MIDKFKYKNILINYICQNYLTPLQVYFAI